MKKTALWLSALVFMLALTLTSCYWRPNFSSGGLRVDVSRAAARVGNPGEVIRVYLIADGLLFSTGGGAPFMAEVPASGDYSTEQEISISGLPVGPKYKAMIGVGPVNSGIFEPSYYGESGQFLVSPNADTAVPVYLNYVPFSGGNITFDPDLLGDQKLVGVVTDYGTVLTAETARTHAIYLDISTFPYTWTTYESYDLTGYQVNGLSKGSTSISAALNYVNTYLDTDNGILPFGWPESFQFDTTFSQTLGGSRNIIGSGSLYSNSYYSLFFRRKGGLGGTSAYIESTDPSYWTWVNLDVANVSDLVVSDYNAYYAADGAVFALPPAFLQDPYSTLAGYRTELPGPATVQCLGFRRDVTGAQGGTLSLGTTNGIWQVIVDETEGVISSDPSQPYPLDITAGDSIERIAISGYNDYAEAYLSRYYLYIRYYDGSYIDKIPFFAVVPGRATGMTWDDKGVLYVSGTEGLAAVYVGYFGSAY